MTTQSDRFEVGAYYFPNWHVDGRNEQAHGPGWTEWELTQAARPRFEGHRQPLVPAWGYQDEADPAVMERKIDAAADHGLTYWIFDWYWYDDGPFLDRCLEQAYLAARNNQRVKFCCMWANHDWLNIHPAKYRDPRTVLYPGKVTEATFERLTDHVVGRYFTHPAHFNIDGRPYFSVYELGKLVESFGGVAQTRAALDRFRAKTVAAGLAGLHLNAVVWGRPVLPGESTPTDPRQLVADLGFDSVTSYVWIHHVGLPEMQTDYAWVQQRYFEHWQQMAADFDVPYYPNVSMGWDSSPRTVQSDRYDPASGYPFGRTIAGNTPDRFEQALRATRQRLEPQAGPRVLNINAWNEWTEGSYLEPDTVHGLGYLEAIARVFPPAGPK